MVRLRVPQRVGQRLPYDPDRCGIDGGRQRTVVAHEVDAHPARADPVEECVETGERVLCDGGGRARLLGIPD